MDRKEELTNVKPLYNNQHQGWEPMDELIQDHVCEALWRNQKLDSTEIEVSVHRGCITLNGKVDGDNSKHEAENCVRVVPGVMEIKNNLTFRH